MSIGTLSTDGKWAVNGTPIYVPSHNMKVQHTNIASSASGRTEDGVMHIGWVRRDVRKINLEYSALTGAELKYMYDLMQGKEFTITVYDSVQGGIISFSAYCGETTYTMYTQSLYTDEGGLYKDIAIHAEEM